MCESGAVTHMHHGPEEAVTGGRLLMDQFIYFCRCITTEETPFTRNDIGVQVSLGTFKLFFEAGSEDVLLRERSEDVQNMLNERALARHEERKKSPWLL